MMAKVKSKKVKVMKSLMLLCLSIGLFGFAASAQSDGSQQNLLGKEGTFAIRGAKIFTVSGETIESGTVVLKDGKILAVGSSVAIPSDAQVIDGKGLSVYPGMIDAATTLGLVEISLSAEPTVDVAESGDMNANAKAIVGLNPHTSHVNVARVNGVTTVLTSPTGGVVAGQSALINLWGSTQEQMAVVSLHSLAINFPRISTFAGFGGGPQLDYNDAVKQRDKRLEDLKKVFRDAAEYARIKEAYEKDKTLLKPATNIKMDAMIPFIRGEKPILFNAERERDIRSVAKFVEEMKVKGIIVGGQDAWKAADVLKKNNISVIYTNIYALPVQDDDAYDYLFEAPSKMQKAGIRFCISTGNDGPQVRDLPNHAGMAVAFGLSQTDALKSVTINAAEVLGVADKMGSIDAGKIANIVVTDGDLLEPRTSVKYLFINGRLLPLTSRHTELFERFKDRK